MLYFFVPSIRISGPSLHLVTDDGNGNFYFISYSTNQWYDVSDIYIDGDASKKIGDQPLTTKLI